MAFSGLAVCLLATLFPMGRRRARLVGRKRTAVLWGLAGLCAAAAVYLWISGIQAQGTMAVADGYPPGPAGPGGSGVAPSSVALHEIYLQPVEDAVRADTAGVLCSPARPAGPGAASAAGIAGIVGTAATAGTGATAGTAGTAGSPAAVGGTATAGAVGSSGTAPVGPATVPASPATAPTGPGYASGTTSGAARNHAGPAPCGSKTGKVPAFVHVPVLGL